MLQEKIVKEEMIFIQPHIKLGFENRMIIWKKLTTLLNLKTAYVRFASWAKQEGHVRSSSRPNYENIWVLCDEKGFY